MNMTRCSARLLFASVCAVAFAAMADGSAAAENRQIENWAVLQRQSPVAGLWQIDILKPQRGYRKYFYLDLTGVPGLLWLSRDKTVTFN